MQIKLAFKTVSKMYPACLGQIIKSLQSLPHFQLQPRSWLIVAQKTKHQQKMAFAYTKTLT